MAKQTHGQDIPATDQALAEAAQRAAADAAEQTRRQAEERAEIERCKRALEPLANIRAGAPYYGGEYIIHRARQEAKITAGDIELAAKVFADPAATLAQCRAALAPLARLPVDVRVDDPARVLYSFPAAPVGSVEITTQTIETARRLAGG